MEGKIELENHLRRPWKYKKTANVKSAEGLYENSSRKKRLVLVKFLSELWIYLEIHKIAITIKTI